MWLIHSGYQIKLARCVSCCQFGDEFSRQRPLDRPKSVLATGSEKPVIYLSDDLNLIAAETQSSAPAVFHHHI